MSAQDNLSHPQFFDKWHGKAFRIATTPSGKRKDFDTGETLPDEPGTYSIVTPENGDAWEWPAASKSAMNMAKEHWSDFVNDPEAEYKKDQIRRSVKKYKK